MIKKLFLFIFLVLSVEASGQTKALIQFDTIAFQTKSKISGNIYEIEDIVKKINESAVSDTSKLFLIAGWIYDNLSFDVDRLDEGGGVPSYKNVLKSRIGLCGDYAALFSEFCNRLKLKNEIIEGYVQEIGVKNTQFPETNHAWNVVQLGGEWFHCDLLWMSGAIKNESGKIIFEKELNKNMILTQSTRFLNTHIPADPMWQLTNNPHSLSDLINGADFSIDGSIELDYRNAIDHYVKLSKTQKRLQFADNAYRYNKDNSIIVVISNLNAAVELMNKNSSDKSKRQTSREYLLKAKKHLQLSSYSDPQIKNQIDKMLQAIKI